MRIPKIENYDNDQESIIITLPKMEISKTIYMFPNDKAKYKFVEHVKMLVRSSFEYREYTSYLRKNCNMNKCMFFPNLDKLQYKKFTIEIHHEPFSLADIIFIVLNKYMEENLTINPLIIAEEVMLLHFKGEVGLVPIALTPHQLVERGKVFIPLQYVDDGFFDFYDKYEFYIPDNLKDILKQKINMSKTMVLKDNNILNKKFIYIENEGYDSIPETIK